MSIWIRVPADLERRSAIERARFWSKAYSQLREPNRRLIALLDELAAEVELGQRTTLTFLGPRKP